MYCILRRSAQHWFPWVTRMRLCVLYGRALDDDATTTRTADNNSTVDRRHTQIRNRTKHAAALEDSMGMCTTSSNPPIEHIQMDGIIISNDKDGWQAALSLETDDAQAPASHPTTTNHNIATRRARCRHIIAQNLSLLIRSLIITGQVMMAVRGRCL